MASSQSKKSIEKQHHFKLESFDVERFSVDWRVWSEGCNFDMGLGSPIEASFLSALIGSRWSSPQIVCMWNEIKWFLCDINSLSSQNGLCWNISISIVHCCVNRCSGEYSLVSLSANWLRTLASKKRNETSSSSSTQSATAAATLTVCCCEYHITFFLCSSLKRNEIKKKSSLSPYSRASWIL